VEVVAKLVTLKEGRRILSFRQAELPW